MVEAMEIKAGFKQTEVGAIPNDWIPSTVDELIRFEGGSQPPLSTFSHFQKAGYIRLLQIRDYKTDRYLTYIPEKLARKKCTTTDIMIGRYGPPIFQILKGLEGAYNVALIKAIPCEELIPDYTLQFLKQKSLFYFIEKLSQRSGGQTGIDIQELKKYPFPIPPTKTEQTAIATTLNDADALITQLEKLIAKKRAIKQGAMHELLTGEKKLDGYNDDWHEIELRGIVDQFIVPMRDKPKRFSGDTPWCRIEDFEGKYLYDSKAKQYVDESTILAMNLKVFPKETLIVSCSADLGRCAILKRPLVTNQTFIGLVVNKVKTSNEFLYYFMGFNSERLNQLSSGTTIAYLSREQFESFKVIIPKTKDEQTHIAQILSDMDAEIEALENKLNKYKMIKQGMMQNLLTGRIRLV